MRRTIALLFLLLTAAGCCLAWPLSSHGDIGFTVDGAAFADTKGTVWQQLYWSIPAGSFAPFETLGTRMTRFRTVVRLSDSAGSPVLNEDWKNMAPMPSEVELRKKNYLRLDQIDARSLRPGAYHLSFGITDLVSAKSGTLETDIMVPAIRTDRPALSQIELCTDIRADSAETHFRKGGLRAVPNPGRIFTEAATVAYYYFEVYGLSGSAGTRLRVSYNTANDSVSGTVVDETLSTAAAQAAKTGGVKLDDLPQGDYQLWAQLLDGHGHPLAAASADFTIKRNPMAVMPGTERMQEEQTAMEKEAGQYYQRIEYLASGRQMDTYKTLDSIGRREFLRQFWKARDTDTKTPQNEALIEHVRRCAYADAQFSEHVSNGLQGSRTDRGRIYIKFGDPEESETKSMQMGSKPVLIWRYTGGQKFIFMDLTGAGRYDLIYTNAAGERSNHNWQKLLPYEVLEAEGLAY